MEQSTKNNPKVMKSWVFYDWSNSVYALVINSTIFPIYYGVITKNTNFSFFGANFLPSEIFAHSLSLAFIIIVALIFILTPIADFTGRKKFFMKVFCYIGSLSCIALFFVNSSNPNLALVLNITMAIGFYVSLVFYNSYLPDIADKKYHDKLSSKGFMMGYAGSIVLLGICLALIMGLGGDDQEKSSFYTRLSFVLTGIWWAGFAQYTFKYLPENPYNHKLNYKNLISNSFNELKTVAKEVFAIFNLKIFLISFFFYSVGMQTIFFMATVFGDKELGLPAEKLILTILLLQVLGIFGAFLFSKLSIKYGNKIMLMIAVFIWILVCLGAYMMNKDSSNIEYMFYTISGLVGLVMGGIQALSRSTYSKLLPKTDDTASFFSFYDVIEKIALILGTFVFGYVNGIFQSMQNSTLSMGLFFVLGFISLSFLKLKKTTEKE